MVDLADFPLAVGFMPGPPSGPMLPEAVKAAILAAIAVERDVRRTLESSGCDGKTYPAGSAQSIGANEWSCVPRQKSHA
jgi:hypothetical protein